MAVVHLQEGELLNGLVQRIEHHDQDEPSGPTLELGLGHETDHGHVPVVQEPPGLMAYFGSLQPVRLQSVDLYQYHVMLAHHSGQAPDEILVGSWVLRGGLEVYAASVRW